MATHPKATQQSMANERSLHGLKPATLQASSTGNFTGRGNRPPRRGVAVRVGLARSAPEKSKPAFHPHARRMPSSSKSRQAVRPSNHSSLVVGSLPCGTVVSVLSCSVPYEFIALSSFVSGGMVVSNAASETGPLPHSGLKPFKKYSFCIHMAYNVYILKSLCIIIYT